MTPQFIDLAAAADFMGPGAIEVSRYQTEITDIVRRRGIFGQRIKQAPATGHPSRFFEQTDIASLTAANAFVDPRNISPVVASPSRVERSVPLKALVSQINYSQFDLEVGAQQQQFVPQFIALRNPPLATPLIVRMRRSRCSTTARKPRSPANTRPSLTSCPAGQM